MAAGKLADSSTNLRKGWKEKRNEKKESTFHYGFQGVEKYAEGGKKGGIRAVLFGNRICNWVFKRRYFGFDVGEFWWEKEI